MTDLRTQLRDYLVETTESIDIEALLVLERPELGAPAPRRRWRAPLAFAAAVVVVGLSVGLAAMLLGGDGETVTPATTPVVVTTAAPEVTTTTEAAPATTAAPPVTTLAPAALAYDEVIDGTAAAFSTSMTLTSDGNPVIASYVRDPAFDDEPTTSAVRLVLCLDPLCAEAPVAIDLAGVEWGSPHLAVDPLDRPVVGFYGEDGPTILFCDDAACSGFETRLVEEPGIWVSGWAFAPGGNPVYADVVRGGGARLDLVSCLDRFCDATSRTAIESASFSVGGDALRVADDGGVLLTYSTGEPVGPPDPEAGYDGADLFGARRVAWCVDPACTGGPVLTTIDEGVVHGHGYFVEGTAGLEVWYVAAREHIRRPTGREDEHLAVDEVTYGKAACRDVACTDFELSLLGPYEIAGASESPLPFRLPETAAPDGTRVMLERRGDALVLERWSEADGGTWAFTEVAAFETGGFGWAHDAALGFGSNSLPVIVYGDLAGVHVIRCPDLACTPPGG